LRERLRQFFHSQNLTPNKAEDICRFPRGTLQKYLSGTNIGTDKIERIAESFPALNVDWWFTGYGHMLKSQRDPVVNESATDPIQTMASWMAKMEREIYMLNQRIAQIK